jgi:hypothetical protein
MANYFYDQYLITVSMVRESAYRTTPSGKDTAIAADVTTYALPVILKDGADFPLPIRKKEEVYGIGSGKYPTKIFDLNFEPVDFTIEGSMQLPTFLGYALGNVYTSTGAQAEITYVDCVADVSDNLDETYFTIYDGTDDYDVWMDATEDGVWTGDPSGQSGGTIKAAFATNATATVVAASIATAVNADAKFTATSSAGRVTITSADSEAHTDAYDNDTNFRVFVSKQGVPATSLAQRVLEDPTHAMESFTLHVEQLNTTSGENIIYDLLGCVVESCEIEMGKEPADVICRAGIKSPCYVAGLAQDSAPEELSIGPYVWTNLDNSSTTGYRLIDEAHTDRAPEAIDKILFKVANVIDFKFGIGDEKALYPISGKREVNLEIGGFTQKKTLYDYWRQKFDNVNKRMDAATTYTSGLLRLIRTAGTDLIVIYAWNLYLNSWKSKLQSIDESIASIDVVLRATNPDVAHRQIYVNSINGTTYTKVYFQNQDEA